MPGQSSIMKYEKYFLGDFLSADFWQKTLRVNKSAMKKFLKNLSFEVDIKLLVPPLTYKINAHNKWWL